MILSDSKTIAAIKKMFGEWTAMSEADRLRAVRRWLVRDRIRMLRKQRPLPLP